jgi:hypothetical protein
LHHTSLLEKWLLLQPGTSTAIMDKRLFQVYTEQVKMNDKVKKDQLSCFSEDKKKIIV